MLISRCWWETLLVLFEQTQKVDQSDAAETVFQWTKSFINSNVSSRRSRRGVNGLACWWPFKHFLHNLVALKLCNYWTMAVATWLHEWKIKYGCSIDLFEAFFTFLFDSTAVRLIGSHSHKHTHLIWEAAHTHVHTLTHRVESVDLCCCWWDSAAYSAIQRSDAVFRGPMSAKSKRHQHITLSLNKGKNILFLLNFIYVERT